MKLFRNVASALVFLLLVYLGAAFVMADANPMRWSPCARGAMVTLWAVLLPIWHLELEELR